MMALRVLLTEACNLRCPHCFAGTAATRRPYGTEVSISDIATILDACVDERVTGLSWQGGEPLLHSAIKALAQEHVRRSIRVDLFTNAVADRSAVESARQAVDRCLVNYVAPEFLTDRQACLRNEAIALLIGSRKQPNVSVMLGYTLARVDDDPVFLPQAIREHGIRRVRLDVARPSLEGTNVHVAIEELPAAVTRMHEIGDHCYPAEVHLDCCLPLCRIPPADRQKTFMRFSRRKELFRCGTVLTISPGLGIGSCYSAMGRLPFTLSSFPSLAAADALVRACEDHIRWSEPPHPECSACSLFRRRLCQGGCLGYRRVDRLHVAERFMLSWGDHQLEPWRMLETAERLLRSRRYAEAFEAFGTLTGPNEVESHVGSAIALAHLNDARSFDHVMAVIEADPTEYRRCCYVLRILAQTGHAGRAEKVARQARDAYDALLSQVPYHA
jgi:hypothetical protein